MGAQEWFDKTYVKLYYIPPKNPQTPADCRRMRMTKEPELRLLTGQISKLEGAGRGDTIGIEVVDHVVSGEGAGGVILLLQVSAYIEWEYEFTPAPPPPTRKPSPWDGYRPSIAPPDTGPAPWVTAPAQPDALPPVRETHRVFVSLPMLYKISGPRILLLALSIRAGMVLNAPLPTLSVWAAKIAAAYNKLQAVDRVLHTVRLDVLTAVRGFCPADVRTLEESLKELEKWLNSNKRWVLMRGGEDKDIASLVRGRGDGTGRSAGNRVG